MIVLWNDLVLSSVILPDILLVKTHIYNFYDGCIGQVLFLHIHLIVIISRIFLEYLFYLNLYCVFHQKAKEHIDLYKGRTGVLKNSFEEIFCLMKLMVFYQMTSLHYFVRWVHFFIQGTQCLVIVSSKAKIYTITILIALFKLTNWYNW